MSGRIIYRAHNCDVPTEGAKGDIWQCDCGRRYRCVDPSRRMTLTRSYLDIRAGWRRHRRPWPRITAEDVETERWEDGKA